MDSEIDDSNLVICLPRGVCQFRSINLKLCHHIIIFPYKSLRKLINMVILCKKYSMGLTGRFKVLYDILQHEFENIYFFLLLYCSHFVIHTKNTQKRYKKIDTKIFL